MAQHPRIVFERGFTAADCVFAVIKITHNHNRIASMQFFNNQTAQHAGFGHAAH